MKTLLSGFIFMLSLSALQGHAVLNDPVLIRVGNGFIRAEHRVKGPLNLYVHSFLKEDFIETSSHTVGVAMVKAERFFLSAGGDVVEITPVNYKKKIKQYLPNAPALHKRLGRAGFRFENLTSMIKFYNDFRVPAQIAYAEKDQ